MISEDLGGHRDRMDFCRAVTLRIPELAMYTESFWAGYGPGLLRYFAPRPRLNAMLQRVAARHRLVLVSNGSGTRQREKLKRAELDPIFSIRHGYHLRRSRCQQTGPASSNRRPAPPIAVRNSRSLSVTIKRDIAGAHSPE